jgi:hypothetical protein
MQLALSGGRPKQSSQQGLPSKPLSRPVAQNPCASSATLQGPIRTEKPRLAFPINDTTLRQVVGREFHTYAVARHDADEVLTHASGNVCHDDVSTFDFNAEARIRQGLGYSTLYLQRFFLLFCHKVSNRKKWPREPTSNKIDKNVAVTTF